MIYKPYEKILEKEGELYLSYNESKKLSKEELKSRMSLYRKKVNEIKILFKEALFREYGLEENEKRELLWEKAYSSGHSGGFSEIEIEFDNMVDLIK